MSPARVLFCNRKRKASFHHTSFLGGGPCLAAGQLIVQDGVLSELYLHSGHYRPTGQHLHHLLAHLRTLGVDLTTVSVDAQRTFKVARAEGNAAKKVTSMMRSAALVLAFLESKAAAARRGSVFDELRATACRRPSSDNGAAAGVGADDGDDHLARLTRACQVSRDAGDTAEGSFAAAPLEADASATERFMDRALAAPGTTAYRALTQRRLAAARASRSTPSVPSSLTPLATTRPRAADTLPYVQGCGNWSALAVFRVTDLAYHL